jgi:hypothetical protein
MKVKHLYLRGRVIVVGNGQNTNFWEDPWCGSIALKDKFKDLFEICLEQDVSVAYMAERGWRLQFRRWLDERAQNQLRHLRDLLLVCPLSNEKDIAKWSWEKSGAFSVKSMYNHLFSGDPDDPNTKLWKAKIPLKIKIFLWLIQQNAILTKDNLSKRNWTGDLRCYFCNENENIEHLFFSCSVARYIWSLISYTVKATCRPASFSQFWEWVLRYMPANNKIHVAGLTAVCWAIWKTRNAVCFEEKSVKSPTEIVCLASSFIMYWAGLHQEGERLDLEAGAEALKATALHFHQRRDSTVEDDGAVVLM